MSRLCEKGFSEMWVTPISSKTSGADSTGVTRGERKYKMKMDTQKVMIK